MNNESIKQMSKFKVVVRKFLDVEVPVEAPDREKAFLVVNDLINKEDTKFIFNGIDPSCWETFVRSVHVATEEEFDALARETECVNADGTHGWK